MSGFAKPTPYEPNIHPCKRSPSSVCEGGGTFSSTLLCVQMDKKVFNEQHNLQVGVLCIPRKNIMGKVDAREIKTLIILISASVCILVVGCISIFILTNGVSKEMKLRAELISHLDARRKAEASSNFKSQFLANMRLVLLTSYNLSFCSFKFVHHEKII